MVTFETMATLRSFLLFGLFTTWGAFEIVGQETWRRTFGGHGTESATSVEQTADGGYIVSGTCGSFGNGASDVYVIRLDASGARSWSRTYGSIGVEFGAGCKVLDDGFVIAGTTSVGIHGGYDMLLVRTDLEGNVLWQREFGTSEWDLCNALEVFDDGFLLGGITYGNGAVAGQAYLVRTDAEGNILWTAQANEPFGSEFKALAGASNGAFIAAGRVGSAFAEDDSYLVKYDHGGVPQWSLNVGGDSADVLNGVVLHEDGLIVANGTTASELSTTQIYLLGVSASGELAWERFIGSVADAGGTGIARAHGSGYVITGYNMLNLGEPDMIFTRVDDDGYWQSGNNYGNGRPAMGHAISRTADGGYVLAGWSEEYGPGLRSVYVVKVDEAGQTGTLTVTPFFDPVSLSPTPALSGTPSVYTVASEGSWLVRGVTARRYRILDTAGRCIASGNIADSRVPCSGLPPGIYIVEIHDIQGASWTSRVIVSSE